MGIKGLYALIKKHAPEAIREVTNFKEIEFWRVGVDASLSVYQWCSVGKLRNIVNKDGKYINHIQGAFFRSLRMILMNIDPCYIFDGKPPDLKSPLIEARRKMRNNGQSVKVPHNVFGEVQKLLELMGISYFSAPSEAESQAAVMVKKGFLDAVCTEDADALVFGTKYLIRGLDATSKSFTLINTEIVLQKLKLTHAEFVDLCILLGCDYTGTIPGVGPAKALQLIQKYSTIEQTMVALKLSEINNFEFIKARELFIYPLVSDANRSISIRKLNLADLNKLQDYLIKTHGLEPKRVYNSLVSLARFNGIDIKFLNKIEI